MSFFEKVSAELNPAQLYAVENLLGPMLILAGAGSGKTRVLTYRVANLIAEGEATPDEILAVTFTNKAAGEMEHRIVSLLRSFNFPVFERMWISTFHSICVRILRQEIHHLGYLPFFTIYDDDDQVGMIKRVSNDLNINDKQYAPRVVQSRINHAKMLGLTPDLHASKLHFLDHKTIEIFEHYERNMRQSNCLDFGDLLLKTKELFAQFPDVLRGYQDKFKFILVDEYQDTNHIQYLLIQMLAKHHRNLCVVGDEDQSIYSWRGADITNILNFESDFPDCKVVKLEQNYRSTKTIIEAASHLITNNTQRKDKTLFTENDRGEPIIVQEEQNEYDEARFVARNIEELRNQHNQNYSDVAIFYRTNAQSRVIEDQLRSRGIPYRIVGGVKFYERMEVKDVVAYMRLLLNPSDDMAFKRVINVPTRGIGKTTLVKIEERAFHEQKTLWETTQLLLQEKAFNSGTKTKIQNFCELIQKLQSKVNELKPTEIYHQILDQTSYIAHLKSQEQETADSRVENLEELDNAMAQFEKERGDEATLSNFLEEIALVSELDRMEEDTAAVTMMTLHLSKGLEYPSVFIIGMEEGLFPSHRSINSIDEGSVEEERRLAYVGITRAREKLFLSYAKVRRVWGVEQSHTASRFIEEIPQTYMRFNTGSQNSRFLQKFLDRQLARKQDAFQHSETEHAPFPQYEAGDDLPKESASKNTSTKGTGYKQGMRVRHPIFGVGSIVKTEGAGEEQKISVVFYNNQEKKFVLKYARLEPF